MSAQSPRAFLMSAFLHGLIAALILFLTWSANRKMTDAMPIVQLVAGDGNNFAATEAPALGIPGGLKVDVPTPKAPEPEALRPVPAPVTPEPVQMTPAPVQPAPTPAPEKKAVEKAPPKTPSLATQIQSKMKRAETKAKREVAKERAAEAKRQAAEEEKMKKLTKAEFDAQNKAKAPVAAKSAPTKVAKIDTEGIAKGVVGGSTANKTGGARGKAMTANNVNEMAAYISFFKQEMRRLFEAPPGLNDSLKVEIEFRSNANGAISNARVATPSGSREFDQAVLDALRKVDMPERPDKKTTTHTFTFTAKEQDEN